ncbi:Scr1 family TA system antitoxin-like transcriptional regulator [Streptomyces sp. NPDC058195]|uniref:Scr1 family TA system antitoxin-like transcriptional regulator n=1 Tax=Streptomyces sp. NPDC058195 TaxID=3346375 RepID=UPI0036E7D5C1
MTAHQPLRHAHPGAAAPHRTAYSPTSTGSSVGLFIAGVYLRSLRMSRELGVAAVCKKAALTRGKLLGAENGTYALGLDEITALLTGPYNMPEQVCRGLVDFLQAAADADLVAGESVVDTGSGWQGRLAALEHRATAAVLYTRELPGFLREPDHTSPLGGFGAGIPRPGIIGTDTTVITDESVLGRLPRDPELRRAQLQRLLAAADDDRVQLRLLPHTHLRREAGPLTELIVPASAPASADDLWVYITEADGSAVYDAGPAAEARLGGLVNGALTAALTADETRVRLRAAATSTHPVAPAGAPYASAHAVPHTAGPQTGVGQ